MKNQFQGYRIWITKLVLSACVVFIRFNGEGCAAQELSIGVPLEDQAINIIESDHPFGRLILGATTQPLLREENNKSSHIKLLLADSFSLDLNHKMVEVRLRSGASFNNSKLVDESDLKASLNRCVVKPTKRFLSQYSVLPSYRVYSKNKRIFVAVESEQGQEAIVSFIENCPILEERTIRLFGEDLGSANLILGTGSYQLVSRTKNREARLERVAKVNAWAAVLTLRGFGDAEHALTALRTGTIDAFYTQQQSVYEKAVNDPTLLISSCGVYNIILRKGLELSCSASPDPGSFKYSALQ